MNFLGKKQIKSYIIDYLKKKIPNFVIKNKLFTCPNCKKISANIFPVNSNKVFCYSPECQKIGDIFQICRQIDFEGNEDVDDESIAKFLKKEFKIQTNDDVDKLLQKYADWGWDLMPIVKNEKIPYQGKDWSNKSCKDIKVWQDWVNSELNIASRCGEKSNNIIIDIDFLTTKEADIIAEGKDKVKTKELLAKKEKNKKIFDEKYKQYFNETVTQDTKNKGIHFIYLYDKDLPKTSFDLDGIHFDIETNGGYCLVAPSIINGKVREIVGDIISEMNWELKELLLKNCSNKKIEKKIAEKSKIIIPNENELSFENLNGNRNNTFNHLMGILRKRYPIKEVEYITGLFNKLIDKQVPVHELKAMLQQIAKYDNLDTSELVNKIWDYLQKHTEATARDLESYFKADSKEIKDILVQLMEENKVFRQRGTYKAIKKANWKDVIIDYVKVISYIMPYFGEYNTFREGDMICIGARPGIGKCITNGYLCTNQGLIDIKDIGEKKPYGISKIGIHTRLFNGHCKTKNYRSVNYFYKESVSHTIKIITDYGFEIEGTPEHPIKIINKNNQVFFKKLSDLTVSDFAYLVIPDLYAKKPIKNRKLKKLNRRYANGYSYFDENTKIDEKMAKLFGYIIGDGSLQKNQVTIFQDKKLTFVIREIENLLKYFNLKYSISYSKNKQNCCNIRISNAKFTNYVRTCLFESKKINKLSSKRNIPKRILRASKEIQMNFIAGLLNAESSINMHKFSGNLEITMANKKIIDVLQLLLLNMGILSKKTLKKVKKYPNNNYYRLSFTSEMTNKILKTIQPMKYKNVTFNSRFHVYKQMKYIGNNQHTKNSYFKDKIIKIDHSYKKVDVYDFNIESSKYKVNNQFWSNGFISHNTHVAMNIIKKLIQQGIKPNYLGSESRSRFLKIAMELGIKEGEFNWDTSYEPERIELEDDAITIIDWLLPEDFVSTANVYKLFQKQLDRHGGNCFIFSQLMDNDKFYAENQLIMFASMALKYFYGQSNGSLDNVNTFFRSIKARESKIGKQYFDIPTKFENKFLELRK